MSSPYREAALPSRERSDDPLYRVDVSGAPGGPGAHGAHGAHGREPGAHGWNGQDAGLAGRGAPAGKVRLELSRTGEGFEPGAFATIAVRGLAIDAGGGEQRLEAALLIDDRLAQASIELFARGGRGGDGGRGGNGGNGARGRKGRDASRFSSGSDGGPGGNGGNGGHGSHGGDGGHGGEVVAVVAARDTALLMLLEHDVSGGFGGDPGLHGAAGVGGLGGDGGDSYSWSESESYTDSSGNRRTRSVSHRNRGGDDGPTGFGGMTPPARLDPGRRGGAGSMTYEVVADGQVTRYTSRYAPRLVAFVHHDGSGDAIYEPGERCRVTGIELANEGGMPTPADDDLVCDLGMGDWLLPAGDRVIAPRAIAEGARVAVPGELGFRVRDHDPAEPGEPLCVREALIVRAHLPAVRRHVPDFVAEPVHELGALTVQFPAYLEPPQVLSALAGGETSRLRLIVRNRSSQPLGKDSPCGRVVSVRVAAAPGSELGEEHVVLLADGLEVSVEEGAVIELPLLGANEEITVELELSVRRGAPEYLAFTGHVVLSLGALDEPARPRPVHTRAFDVRVARRFVDESADLLLVVHHRTPRTAIEAWETLTEQLSCRLAIWDLSREQHLDLEAPLYDGASLAQRFAGKAIVILNSPFLGPDGECTPDSWLSPAQAVRAARAGLDLAFVGRHTDLDRLILTGAVTDGRTPVEVRSEDEVLAADPDARLLLIVEQTFRIRFWWVPAPDWLDRRAQRLSERLRRAAPERKRLVLTRFAPEIVESSWWWGTRWRVGTLEVVPAIDSVGQSIVQAQVSDEAMQGAEYVRHATTTAAVLTMFDFREQVEQLRRSLLDAGADAALRIQLVDAVLVDLTDELVAAKVATAKGELPRLAHLVGQLPEVSLDAPAAAAVLRLLARVSFVAQSQAAWWQAVPPFRWLGRHASIKGEVRDAVRRALGNVFGQARLAEARERADALRDTLRSEHREQKRAGLAGRRRLWALDMARAPLLLMGVSSDEGVAREAPQRVLAEDVRARLAEAEAHHATARDARAARARDRHGQLFVDKPDRAA